MKPAADSSGGRVQVHSSNQDHHSTEHSPVQHFDTLEFPLGRDSSEVKDVHCPFRKQPPARNTSLIQTILDCNIEYVAIYVPLDTEGWAEMAITASVTDEGMLDDPTPRIGFHKKNKL